MPWYQTLISLAIPTAHSRSRGTDLTMVGENQLDTGPIGVGSFLLTLQVLECEEDTHKSRAA
jgi:hypothetical protein